MGEKLKGQSDWGWRGIRLYDRDGLWSCPLGPHSLRIKALCHLARRTGLGYPLHRKNRNRARFSVKMYRLPQPAFHPAVGPVRTAGQITLN